VKEKSKKWRRRLKEGRTLRKNEMRKLIRQNCLYETSIAVISTKPWRHKNWGRRDHLDLIGCIWRRIHVTVKSSHCAHLRCRRA
jgi:hypothetical protein